MEKWIAIVGVLAIIGAGVACNACVGVLMWYPKGRSEVQIDAPDYGSVSLMHTDQATTGTE